MAASNTKECFREMVGKRVVGVLFDALPRCYDELGTKTLVFDDGSGLTIASNGSFWQEAPKEVHSAVERHRQRLYQCQREINDVLKTAGALGVKEEDQR